MQRELNPNLFGGTERRSPLGESPSNPYQSSSEVKELRAGLSKVESIVEQLTSQMRHCQEEVRASRQQIEDAGRAQESRLQRLAQMVARMEAQQNRVTEEVGEKYASLAGRLNERRVSDNKVEELLDRHNHIVQSFEMRLKQMQKTMADRELQMLKTMAVLEDARAEIARMKRM